MAGAITDLTGDTFETFIPETGIAVVDFWAAWCGPCRAFAPVFEKASEANPDIKFGKVNTDEQQMLAAAFQINSIPTLMVFRDRVLLYAEPGALPASAFDQLLAEVKKVDMAEVRKAIAEQEAAQKAAAKAEDDKPRIILPD